MAGLIVFFLLLAVFFPVLILGWGTFMLLPGDYSFSNLTTHFWVGESDFNIASGQEGIFRNPGIWGGVWNSVRLGVSAALINGFLGLLIGYAVVRNRGSKISKTLEAISFAPVCISKYRLGGDLPGDVCPADWSDTGTLRHLLSHCSDCCGQKYALFFAFRDQCHAANR